MTTIDRVTDIYTTQVAVSMVIPVRVQGAEDGTQAEHDAVRAVRAMLGTKMDGLDISAGVWPTHPFVEVAEPSSMEVELL